MPVAERHRYGLFLLRAEIVCSKEPCDNGYTLCVPVAERHRYGLFLLNAKIACRKERVTTAILCVCRSPSDTATDFLLKLKISLWQGADVNG